MSNIDDAIFEDMLSDIDSMSQEGLIQALKDAPDSGIGYALFGVQDVKQVVTSSIEFFEGDLPND